MQQNLNTEATALSLEELSNLSELAHRVRRRVLRLASVKRVHIGPALSIVEILVSLYFGRLRLDPSNPAWPERDRFILSKGHAALALYATLAEAGFISTELFDTFGQPGNPLAGHPVQGIPGVEAATGSLGHGLSVGAGLALAARMDDRPFKTVVLLGDGELNEGSVWEAALFASHQRLNGLVAVVDRNGYQQEGRTADILNTEPLAEKWRAFGWEAVSVNGHDLRELAAALGAAFDAARGPTVLLASTVKGKGVAYMENDPSWHMGWLAGDDLTRALDALEAGRVEG